MWKRSVVESTASPSSRPRLGRFRSATRHDELVAAGAASPGASPCTNSPTGWTKTPIDDGVAVEDLAVADLNGDGRPEIIAGGRATQKHPHLLALILSCASTQLRNRDGMRSRPPDGMR